MSRKKTGHSKPEIPPEPSGGNGMLIVVATPIGNLEDLTLRALRRLQEADMILAEDTRRTRKLMNHYDISCPVVSYYQEIERKKAPDLLRQLKDGRQLALVTDAGTPAISDPGTYLINQAREQGIPVEILPGASAVVTALAGAGLPTEAFTFIGFLPPKTGARKRLLEQLKFRAETLVFFISPHRLQAELEDMHAAWGDREASLCREMTKIHEEFLRAPLSRLITLAPEKSLGEATLVVRGSTGGIEEAPESIQAQLARLQHEGLSLNQAVSRVAKRRGLPRSEVYVLAHLLNKKSN